MATSAIELDNFPLIGSTPGGGRARVTGFDGWLAVSQRRARDVRTGRHGGYGSTGLRTPLDLMLKGIVTYTDEAACAAERRAMLALGVAGLPVSLEVTDALGSFTVEIEVDEADVKPLNDKVLTFEFTLHADEAEILNATARTTPLAAASTVAIDNDGTLPAELVITVTSPGTVVLTSGGITLTTTSLPSGAVIDTAACTVTSSGGADLFSSVLVAQFPALPAGGGSVQQAGTAALSVVSHDSYA